MENSGKSFDNAESSQSNPIAAPSYEMTVTSVGGACADVTLPTATTIHPLDPRRRKISQYGDYEMNDAQCSATENAVPASATRKRKASSFGTGSTYDEGLDESRSSRATSCATMPDKKQNHSEIEKRRRDKMNTYISELSGMIPMCGAMARKLDKLTVLRMAVAHLRGVRGALSAGPLAAAALPAFLPERELNTLLLHAASDAFLLVVGCDRGRLLYVSHSVTAMLHYNQSELVGQSLFDILHPKDVAKVKEQLSSPELSPRERLIDAKTMLPVKSEVVGGCAGAQRLSPGARRSFFCRIKCKQPSPPPPPPENAVAVAAVKEELDSAVKHRKKNEKKYCVVQCTGYLKSWAAAELEHGGAAEGDEEPSAVSCLVAVGRALPAPATSPAPAVPPITPLQYISRHAVDGKFLFVDQRVQQALGFLPQELLGTSLYELVGGAALGGVARAHQHALLRAAPQRTPPYRLHRKDGTAATVVTHFKPVRNPWTKEVECLVANNTIVSAAESSLPSDEDCLEPFELTKEWSDYPRIDEPDSDDLVEMPAFPTPSPGEGDADVQRLIESAMESHKIGAAIAEEARRRPPSAPPAPLSPLSPLPHHLLHDPLFNASLVDNILCAEGGAFSVRNNVPLSAAGGAPSPAASPAPAPTPAPAPAASPPLPPLALDGNGEAAMAVIMSLLEADAGLGGPVNFSGLPWPLP